MKLTLKLILILSLFSSVAFADGEMGSGGEGEMGSGGKTKTCPTPSPCRPADEPDDIINPTETDTVLTMIQKYLTSIFG
jgi:hypothetical protein